MIRTIFPSRSMRMKALGSKPFASCAFAWPRPSGSVRLSNKLPPAAALVFRNLRREVLVGGGFALERSMWYARSLMFPPQARLELRLELRGPLDGLAGPDISAAATKGARHQIRSAS